MSGLNGVDLLALVGFVYALPVILRKLSPAPAPGPGSAHVCASDEDALRDEARRAAWAEVLNDDSDGSE